MDSRGMQVLHHLPWYKSFAPKQPYLWDEGSMKEKSGQKATRFFLRCRVVATSPQSMLENPLRLSSLEPPKLKIHYKYPFFTMGCWVSLYELDTKLGSFR